MSHMHVSKSVEKAFQLAFLKLKRRRKGVVVGVTAALMRMAIGRCWVCGIGSSTALLLSDAMLLLTKERSGLYPHFQRLLLNEQESFGHVLSSDGGHRTIPPLDHHSHLCCYIPRWCCGCY